VHASYFLTGEFRPYDTTIGTFTRVTPLRPFDPENGAWGAVQVAGRLSYLDLNNSGLYGGKATDVTAGINWYLYSYLRLTANYVYSMTDTGPSLSSHGGNIHLIEARAQIEF
jgi:phosphate-selective porin OprO/OprP